jgi:hypothetical protein
VRRFPETLSDCVGSFANLFAPIALRPINLFHFSAVLGARGTALIVSAVIGFFVAPASGRVCPTTLPAVFPRTSPVGFAVGRARPILVAVSDFTFAPATTAVRPAPLPPFPGVVTPGFAVRRTALTKTTASGAALALTTRTTRASIL